MRNFLFLLFSLLLLSLPAQASGILGAAISPAEPTPALAAKLFGLTRSVYLRRQNDGIPGWVVLSNGDIIGYIGSTWKIAKSLGYSGRPLDVLVAVSPKAVIVGAKLMQHNEPVLTLGISDADITRYVNGFAGFDLTASHISALDNSADLPDVISRATVSTGVIRDGILRTARTLAIANRLIGSGGGIDRLSFTARDWAGLIKAGALAHKRVGMDEAAQKMAGAKVPVPPGKGAFLDLYAGLIDPPSIGQNLLGQQTFTRAIGTLGQKQTALIVISSGLYSHRGTSWRKTGIFDRLTVVQNSERFVPTEDDYIFIKKLAASGAPEVKEISLFRLPPRINPLKPFQVEVTASRPAKSGQAVTFKIVADYALKQAYLLAPLPEQLPLWQKIWDQKHLAIGIVLAILAVQALALFAQESITKRPALWRWGRIGFLLTTLLVLGWGLNGQLSVVQVVAFLHSLLTGFHWETFLIDPVIFLLWSFVAMGLLFWGRGVYCGWLCPFGALQELMNLAAVRLGVKQIVVPQAIHERLWVIKYTLFMAILALSFQSMHNALILAEVEPFKTAISLRMIRAWPFVLFVLVILFAGLFIERFYCRYLCPLGAALAIPAKLKIFDWLHRRPQCGRECRLCETKCTVGAIDPLGRINPNECVLCMRCQVVMNDPNTCPVLKRRARGAQSKPQTPVPTTGA